MWDKNSYLIVFNLSDAKTRIFWKNHANEMAAGESADMYHYADVIMGMIASQITSHTAVYSIVYSGADQRKHQSSASLAIVRGIHRDRWIPRTKGP